MVGWCTRKSTKHVMSGNDQKSRTGIFALSKGAGIVVYWEGREICRYASMAEFIDAHLAGVAALEKKQEDLLAAHYRDKL